MGFKARPPVSARQWYERGVRAAESGELAVAERAYRSAVAAEPAFAEAHTNLGTVLQLQGRLRDAEASYRTAVSLAPTSANAHANLGSVSYALGDVSGAEALYRRAIELDPSAAHNHAGLGAALHAQERFDEAAAALGDAIAYAPMWAEPRRTLGLARFRAGSALEAVDACLSALALDGHDITARSVLGLALGQLGQNEAAVAQLARVVKQDPTSASAQFNLGIALQRVDRAADAVDAYRAVLAHDPGNVRAQLNLAGALMRLDRHDDAVAEYRRVLELDPDEPTARHLVAALSGDTTTTAPAGYVRALFDDTAPAFDAHLRRLDYSAPAVIRRVVEAIAARPLQRILDLGCGTGMVGAELRALAGELVGVDLSSGMLAEARRGGHYDQLHLADVVDYLRSGADLFDVATAGDVMIYIGDLAPLLAALPSRLRDGGVFVFSTEVGEGTWQLMPTGRYTHSDPYVAAVAQQAGFEVVSRDSIMLRYEHGEPVAGAVFALRASS